MPVVKCARGVSCSVRISTLSSSRLSSCVGTELNVRVLSQYDIAKERKLALERASLNAAGRFLKNNLLFYLHFLFPGLGDESRRILLEIQQESDMAGPTINDRNDMDWETIVEDDVNSAPNDQAFIHAMRDLTGTQ